MVSVRDTDYEMRAPLLRFPLQDKDKGNLIKVDKFG